MKKIIFYIGIVTFAVMSCSKYPRTDNNAENIAESDIMLEEPNVIADDDSAEGATEDSTATSDKDAEAADEAPKADSATTDKTEESE